VQERGWRARLQRGLDRLAPERNASAAVYGTIAVGVLLAAESKRQSSFPDLVAAIAIAMVLYWLAHSYASALGERLERRERLSLRLLWRRLAHERAIIEGASPPLVVLLIAWAAGATVGSAVTAALWTCAASVALLELLAGLRARLGVGELGLQVSTGLALGAAIVLLRVLLK
jgi:hypothetical protein